MSAAQSKQTLTHLHQLADAGFVAANRIAALAPVAQRYAIAVPPAVQALIDRQDPNDPIARQFIPDARELQAHPQELADPIGDRAHAPVAGIVHRYPNRALLKVVSVCPVYCRFCFRREMVGPDHGGVLSDQALTDALSYIENHPELQEVIVTGGDPLVLSPRRIGDLTDRLSRIGHVRKLRWHSRVPVVRPESVSPDLIAALTSTNRQVRLAVHTNHHRELTDQARSACQALSAAGIDLLSQTVLLRGVNDDAATLEALLAALPAAAIRPYYLHHGDLAPGTAHLRTTIAAGLHLMDQLAARLDAGAMPTYVLDLPGGHGKVPITQRTFVRRPDGSYRVTAADGNTHAYRDSL